MKLTATPKKMPVPFGVNGSREDLLSTAATGDSTASYNNGFPDITMLNESAGGVPPKGQDFNQILYELAAAARWADAGGVRQYDSSFATSIGGYPKYTRLTGSDGVTEYISTVDDNTTDPDSSSSSGWTNYTNLFMRKESNLSDVANIAYALGNLGFSGDIGESGCIIIPVNMGGKLVNFYLQYGGFSGKTTDSSSWGVYETSSISVTWKKPFPTTCLQVITGGASDVPGTGQQEIAWNLSKSKSGGVFGVQCRTLGATLNGSYIAIGY